MNKLKITVKFVSLRGDGYMLRIWNKVVSPWIRYHCFFQVTIKYGSDSMLKWSQKQKKSKEELEHRDYNSHMYMSYAF